MNYETEYQETLHFVSGNTDEVVSRNYTSEIVRRKELEDENKRLKALVNWMPIDKADPYDGEYLLYGPSLVDPDFNPTGVVEGHWQDDIGWVGAVWCGCQDVWNYKVIHPTHFLRKFNPETVSVPCFPDDLMSHKNSWIAAMERLIELEDNETDKGYYQHELKAMRKMYQELRNFNSETAPNFKETFGRVDIVDNLGGDAINPKGQI